jgi:hypothetical protein
MIPEQQFFLLKVTNLILISLKMKYIFCKHCFLFLFKIFYKTIETFIRDSPKALRNVGMLYYDYYIYIHPPYIIKALKGIGLCGGR